MATNFNSDFKRRRRSKSDIFCFRSSGLIKDSKLDDKSSTPPHILAKSPTQDFQRGGTCVHCSSNDNAPNTQLVPPPLIQMQRKLVSGMDCVISPPTILNLNFKQRTTNTENIAGSSNLSPTETVTSDRIPLRDINNLTNVISKRKKQKKLDDVNVQNMSKNLYDVSLGGEGVQQTTNTENIVASHRIPLSDISNFRNVISKRKKPKKVDNVNVQNILKNLYDESFRGQAGDKITDFENIDHSNIVGFSDSEMESEVDTSEDEEESEIEMINSSKCTDHELWCKQKISEVPPEYHSLGSPTCVCDKCGAQMWKEERCNKKVTKGKPKFSLCCKGGRVILPRVKPTPAFLQSLYDNKEKGPEFRRCVRQYNSMFSFTSMGGKVDDSVNKGGGPYIYRLNGQNHHKIGSLLPEPGEPPKFCQLYIYDMDNEVENRMRWINIKGSHNVDPSIVEGLLQMLDQSNHLVKCFRMARDRFKEEEIVELKIVLKQSRAETGRENHMTPSDEVAGIMVGDTDETCGRRDIVIDSKVDGLRRISEIHPLLMALQYPLLFPYGEDGYHEKMYYIRQPGDDVKVRKTVSMRQFYAQRLMVKLDEGMTMRKGGRLFQQYIVDAFSAIEQSRLWYVRNNQTALRNELYSHICDYMRKGDGDLSNLGRSYILPSSFVGGRRYMQQNFQDALAVCRFIGHPDLFLTMTCNPLWDEVLKMMSLLPSCKPADCPDIIARVFKLKLHQLTDDIKKRNFFGKCIAVMYVVEWQKRGLPHVHMLVWLDGASKRYLNSNVDKFVTAEIPDPNVDPAGYAAVKQFMIHGPCGAQRTKSPCMKNNKCIRHFPKRYCAQTTFDQSGFPIYKRRRTSNTVRVRKAELDNAWVVPYNRELLLRYQCHINIEVCNQARCLKYLFKYCLKGSDRATVEIKSKNSGVSKDAKQQCVDEINRFFDGRYVCAAEACHRIFAFDIHHRSIGVERLSFHLEGKKSITYNRTQKIKKVVENNRYRRSKLEAFFYLCSVDKNARQYTYDQIPRYYVWNKRLTEWELRQRDVLHIGRLSYTHHSTGEVWYLRMLLSKIPGPTSFKHLRTVGGKIYTSYQDACRALGLLDDDKEWDACLTECSKCGLPPQIRELFVQIICNNRVSDLKQLWTNHWISMSHDVVARQRRDTGNPDLQITDGDLQYYTLAEVDKILHNIGKSVNDFKQLPQLPECFLNTSSHNLVLEEKSYDRDEMLHEHNTLISNLNREQKEAYDGVLNAVHRREGGVFFVYGSGGCGKTYVWKTLITKLRSEGKIVLPVASSGIAATLLPGGRTAHSRFKIPILVDELSTCSIAHQSDIAELLKKTDLIIWDEAPMQHCYSFEALDRTLRDIMKSVSPHRADWVFGGIPIVLGGDFRQILPVISRGSRSDIVASCITRSRIWDGCKLYLLKRNMRLMTANTAEGNKIFKQFGQWVLDIGDGILNKCERSSHVSIDEKVTIPEEYCILQTGDSLNTLIEKIFPQLSSRFDDISYLSERAILTPTNETVANLNNRIIDMIPGEVHSYFSVDKAEYLGGHDNEIDRSFPQEYLNSLRLPGLPPHDLKLKSGTLVMLMRNLNQTLGLCNGTRLIVRRCMKTAIQCEVITGPQVGTTHFIPRMDLCPSDSTLPFTFIRRQFPLQLCYAMTINKSQGQSLGVVGLYLPNPVFCHGQLYVALSRVTSPHGLTILIDTVKGGTTNITDNVVYDEVFYNLPKMQSKEQLD